MRLVFFLFAFLIQNIWAVVGSGGNVFGQTHFQNIEDFLAGNSVRITLMPTLTPYKSKKNKSNLTIITSYNKSTNNEKLSQFFLPHGNLLLTVTGGSDYFLPGPLPYSGATPTNKVVRNIDALALGITDPEFSSILQINLKSITKYCGLFSYYTFLFNDDNSPKLSFLCAIPIINYIHKIEGKENIYKTGDKLIQSPIKSALQGLSKSELLHQRWNFNTNGMEKTFIPRIELDLSYNYLPIKHVSIETYFGCLIPLHKIESDSNINKNNKFIFYPDSISNKFFGIQYGTTISLFLYHNNERTIKFVLGNNLLYFLPENEIRSFDLDGKSWSRYLPAYKNFGTSIQEEAPLTNFLTYTCRISPNFSNIATTELHYIKNTFDLALGYSLFARQSESVTILDDLQNVVLKGTNQDIANPLSLVRNIKLRLPYEDVQGIEIDQDTNQKILNLNYYYSKIDNTMIDISSATHPAVFCGELYIKGSIICFEEIQLLSGVSYRFSHNNTAIEYATAWIGLQYFF